jgi:hypothetical protein
LTSWAFASTLCKPASPQQRFPVSGPHVGVMDGSDRFMLYGVLVLFALILIGIVLALTTG